MIWVSLIVGFLAGTVVTFLCHQRYIMHCIKTKGVFFLGDCLYRGNFLYKQTKEYELPEAIVEATQPKDKNK
jgi:hypothetical protein